MQVGAAREGDVGGYVWQQAGGRRHARIGSGTLSEGRVFRTLCGRELEVTRSDDRTQEDTRWLDPPCSACDYKMRKALNAMPACPEYRQKLAAGL
jgi:hypothetical protein